MEERKMKKFLSLAIAMVFAISMLSFAIVVNAVPGNINITGTVDLTEWGQNAMRVLFDQNLTTSDTDLTIANIQALKSGDANYNEAVVNGVLDGIKINDKTVREWNIAAGGDYGAMVHYYRETGSNFLAIYIDPSLADFVDGESHFVSINSSVASYTGLNVLGKAFQLNPLTMVWEAAKLEITQGIDLTPWEQNAMRVVFNHNLTTSDSNLTIANVQKIKPGETNYDMAVVKGVLDGIKINNKSVREINSEAGSEDAIMVHYYRENGDNFIAIYADPTIVDFSDGQARTITLNSEFKAYSMREASNTTLYQDPDTKAWSLTAPYPGMAVTGGDSHPEFAWGNTMRVLFDTPVWVPDDAQELLLNAENLKPGDDYYNEDAVDSILNKIIINGKSVSEWNAINPEAAQVHIGSNENDIRIYMHADNVAFGDGNTHIVKVLRNFISFSGYTTTEEVSLNYDPVAKTWGTQVVVPPTPTPGAPTFVYIAGSLNLTGNFGNVSFYTTTPITRVDRINVQAGGGSIPDEVRDSVRNFIKVDGKTVGEWNEENDSQYAVMVAMESEDAGGGTILGRLSIWADTVDANTGFTPDKDHTVEFLEGLVGLNGATIAPSKWQYVAADMEWYLVTDEGETSPTPTDEEASPTPTDEETQAPGDSGVVATIALLVLAGGSVLTLTKRRNNLIENK